MQLSYGLSSEYSKGPGTENSAEKVEKVDADRQLYAKYYVSQIMQMGEEGIRDAWNKVSSTFSWFQQAEHLYCGFAASFSLCGLMYFACIFMSWHQ